MRQNFRSAPVPELSPNMRDSLSPYIECLEEIIIPAIRSFRIVPKGHRSVDRIKKRIEKRLREAVGHSIHPAIWCYALRVSCHEVIKGIGAIDSPKRRIQFKLLDRAYVLIEAANLRVTSRSYFILEL